MLVLRALSPAPDGRRVAVWRERADRIELDLAAAQRQRDRFAGELRQLTERFNALNERFEALSAATPDIGALPTPTVPGPSAQAETGPTGEFQDVPDEQWEALVRGALASEVERRLGETLPPQRVQRLVDSLEQVRDASRALSATAAASDEVDPQRLELARAVILLQADRSFRDEIGIGVAEFMRGLDPGQVEDVSP